MPRYEVEGVQRAVTVLRALAASDKELGVAELSRALDLGKTTLFRLLFTLELEGLVRQDAVTKKFRLGPDLAVLGRAAADDFDLRRQARPVMERLATETNLPVFLNVPGSTEVVCLEHVASLNRVELYGRAGHTLPYHACPSGYVLLAFGPPQLLESVLQRSLPRYATNTPDKAELHQRLEEVRNLGYSYGKDDLDEGVSSVAVPIRERRGNTVASLGLAGFSVGFDHRRDQLVTSLLAAADEISDVQPDSDPAYSHPHTGDLS